MKIADLIKEMIPFVIIAGDAWEEKGVQTLVVNERDQDKIGKFTMHRSKKQGKTFACHELTYAEKNEFRSLLATKKLHIKGTYRMKNDPIGVVVFEPWTCISIDGNELNRVRSDGTTANTEKE